MIRTDGAEIDGLDFMDPSTILVIALPAAGRTDVMVLYVCRCRCVRDMERFVGTRSRSAVFECCSRNF